MDRWEPQANIVEAKESQPVPDTNVDHKSGYDPAYIAQILNTVRTIALVGASADKTKFSFDVLRVLHDAGYDIIPVNPNPLLTEIQGIKVYHSLAEIDRPVDMVDVFRPKEELYGLAEQAIAIGAQVLWGQLGIYDDRAAQLAEQAGLQVVMDRCPKIELLR